MSITIRPYRESDRTAVVNLTVAAFEGVSIDHGLDLKLGGAAGKDWRWRKGRDIERDLAMPTTELAVAEDSTGAVVGYVTMDFDRDTLIGWIHNLAVAAELRGQGLGRLLIEHALDRFRAAGMTVAKIETLEQNAIGRHLYPSLGFREVARQIHYAMPLRQPRPETSA
jgi:ribosomal protein S18 acetylase RimI-like enzyme